LQERLIYRAHAFIKEEVAGFTPGPQDTDYPSRLESLAAAAAAKTEERAAEGEISSAGEEGAGGQVRLRLWQNYGLCSLAKMVGEDLDILMRHDG
jgi:hypothetical protein